MGDDAGGGSASRQTQKQQVQEYSLSTAMELRDFARHAWDAVDLRAMWQHQLATPLQFGLGYFSAEAAHVLHEAGLDPMLRLGQLLFESPSPPLPLLKVVRRFAKGYRDDRESALPRELLLLAYYVSIVVALCRCDQRITTLGNEPLLRGLRWYGRQDWVDTATRQLLADGVSRLSSPSAPGGHGPVH